MSVGRKSDGNRIEFDGPPGLRRSMRADLLSEQTNERVFQHEISRCQPRLANPLNSLRLSRLIADRSGRKDGSQPRVLPPSEVETDDENITTTDSDLILDADNLGA